MKLANQRNPSNSRGLEKAEGGEDAKTETAVHTRSGVPAFCPHHPDREFATNPTIAVLAEPDKGGKTKALLNKIAYAV